MMNQAVAIEAEVELLENEVDFLGVEASWCCQ
jgi:hypothetical protein